MPLNRDWVEAAADLAVTASGGHRTGIACPPQKAVREAASRLFHQPHASSSRAAVRATLDRTTGSEPDGSGPTGAGCSIQMSRAAVAPYPKPRYPLSINVRNSDDGQARRGDTPH